MHDLVHGVFHLDKGFLFTIKELILRPGHSIREYIRGKRVKHFNYFTLFLIIIAISHFVESYSIIDQTKIYGNEQVNGYYKIAKDYDKVLKILTIPFWALILFVLFRKSKQNYIEMIILSMYMLCGMLLINTMYFLLMTFYNNIEVLTNINELITLLMTLYFFFFVYQYFSVFSYNKISLILLSLFTSIMIIFLQVFTIKLINYLGETYF